MSKWKYGTVLEDTVFNRTLMVVAQIPFASAGEDDLYDAIDLSGDSPDELHAVSPRDKGIHEMSGTRSGTLEIEPAPLAGQPFTISYEER